MQRSVLLFALLWTYATTFGLLAWGVIQLLGLFVDVGRFRIVADGIIIVATAAVGTCLADPLLKRTLGIWRITGQRSVEPNTLPARCYLVTHIRIGRRKLGRG
jgi:hypothetical protein